MKKISSEKQNVETATIDDCDIEKGVEIIDGKYVPLESFQSLQSKFQELEETLEEKEDWIEDLEHWVIETDHMLFHIENMIKGMRIFKFEK